MAACRTGIGRLGAGLSAGRGIASGFAARPRTRTLILYRVRSGGDLGFRGGADHHTADADDGKALAVMQAGEPLQLDPIFETEMAEGLEAMALEGHGLAFLPVSSVRKELKSRRLMPLAADGRLELTIGLRVCREHAAFARHPKPEALALWDFLAHGPRPSDGGAAS